MNNSNKPNNTNLLIIDIFLQKYKFSSKVGYLFILFGIKG